MYMLSSPLGLLASFVNTFLIFPAVRGSTAQVLTSDFHMPRSKVIFEWIFKLAADAGTEKLRHVPEGEYNLSFISVSDEVSTDQPNFVQQMRAL